MTVRLKRPRVLVIVAAATVTLSSCGIRPDSAPRDVPDDLQTPPVGISTGSESAGGARIYLVDPDGDPLLSAVPRDPTSQRNLIEILLLGPNADELSEGYSTAIPSVELLSMRPQGRLLKIDVSEELTALSGQALVQALAQIVYTASELEGVQSVQITVQGEAQRWPRASLEPTAAPLRTYDYPGVLVTAQPAYPSAPAGA